MTNTNNTDRVALTIASADFAARVEAVRAAALAARDMDMVDVATNALEGYEVAQLVVAEYLLEQERTNTSSPSVIVTVPR
jgi:hypothetical protein